MPYQVANPRGIPQGVRIIATATKEWYEGDAITKRDLGEEAWDEYVRRGFVVEVSRGED